MTSRSFLHSTCRSSPEYVLTLPGSFPVLPPLFRALPRPLPLPTGRGAEASFSAKRSCATPLACGFPWDSLESLRPGPEKIVIILSLKRLSKSYFIIVNFFVYNIL